MIPGPTPIPTRVLSAMNHDMIGHRGPLFSAVMKEVMEGLRWAYDTKNEIFIYPSSGTGGMEVAVVNMFSPGDKVIVLNIGNFGSRFAKICKAFGVNVNDVKFERGKPADPKVLEAELKERAGQSGPDAAERNLDRRVERCGSAGEDGPKSPARRARHRQRGLRNDGRPAQDRRMGARRGRFRFAKSVHGPLRRFRGLRFPARLEGLRGI